MGCEVRWLGTEIRQHHPEQGFHFDSYESLP